MEQIFEWSNLAYFPLHSNAMVNNFFLAANCPYSAKLKSWKIETYDF
jgi:hypothetical protein